MFETTNQITISRYSSAMTFSSNRIVTLTGLPVMGKQSQQGEKARWASRALRICSRFPPVGLPGQLPMQFALEAIHPLADVQGSVDQTCLPMSSPFTLGKKSRSHQLKALEKPCTQWPHMAHLHSGMERTRLCHTSRSTRKGRRQWPGRYAWIILDHLQP